MSLDASTTWAALGLDVGEARIGVAVAEGEAILALPLETVAARPPASATSRVVDLCNERDIAVIVVGWPLTMQGREDRATRRVARFVGHLEKALEEAGVAIPIERWDERMTTVAAERALRETHLDGRGRRQHVDQLAATYILQGFLDARQS